MFQDVIKSSFSLCKCDVVWKEGTWFGFNNREMFFSLVQDELCLPLMKVISGKDQKHYDIIGD